MTSSRAGRHPRLRAIPTPPAGVTGDSTIDAALAASHLKDIAPDLLRSLLDGSTRLRVPAAAVIRREGEPGPHVDLVLDGLVRIYLSAPDGRTLTVRYCRRGAILGAVSLFVTGYSMPGAIQALVDAELLSLRPGTVRALADQELPIARALLDELGERVVSFVGEMRDSAFATVRQRIARHLLDLASENQQGPELMAPISQRDLADAVGTVREVVVRVLRELRQEGIVETGRDRIAILAPERLVGELFPGSIPPGPRRFGTSVTGPRNNRR